MKQLIQPNTSVTYVGGLCLKAVQDAYGTDHPYPTAIAQWNDGETQHQGSPPQGVASPIFFTMAGEPSGHVAINLPDGRVASSSQPGTHKGLYIHKDINDLISFYSPVYKLTYLGWKEVVGTQEVIGEEDMKADNYIVQALSEGLLDRTAAGDQNLLNNVGGDIKTVIDTIRSYPEAKSLRERARLYQSVVDENVKLKARIAELEVAPSGEFELVTEPLYKKK